MNNSELIKRLRGCRGIESGDPECNCAEAADALEAADKRVTELEEQLSECAYQVENEFKRANFAEAKNKRLDAALAELRDKTSSKLRNCYFY